MDSIQLLLIAKSTAAKKYGVDLLLQPLIDDIKHLESIGMTINFHNQNLHFFDTVALVISDNLAAHWLSGFQENFSTVKRVCRFCMCLRTEMCKCFLEDKVLQRTAHTYNEHIRAIGINNDLIREYSIKVMVLMLPQSTEIFPLCE